MNGALWWVVGVGSFVKDELLAELEEMEQEELDKNLLEVEGPSNVPLPNVPSTSLPSRPGTASCPLAFITRWFLS